MPTYESDARDLHDRATPIKFPREDLRLMRVRASREKTTVSEIVRGYVADGLARDAAGAEAPE